MDPPRADDLRTLTDDEPLPSLADLGFDRSEADVPRAGTEVARELVEAFCGDAIYEYDEKRDVPADAVHEWHELDEGRRTLLAPDYPAPIVDHGERRETAIEMFELARGD